MLISLIVAFTSQCICIPKHHIIYLEYKQFLFINYTSIKLRESVSLQCARHATRGMRKCHGIMEGQGVYLGVGNT